MDTSLHMNNGRYWTIMDLGRADLLIRSGLWRTILRRGWVPVVSAAQIRFRRELRLFQPFSLETRIVAWAQRWVVMEHRILTVAKDGATVVSAVALVRAGIYDCRAKRFVAIEDMFDAIGLRAVPPAPTTDVLAFLASEEAMKQVG